MSEDGQWRKCSACKEWIGLGADYWVCNVSTCNRKRTGLIFCTVRCWEIHLPGANHRESWAVEKVAPATAQAAVADAEAKPRRRLPPDSSGAGGAAGSGGEVLVVASRLKDYVREQSGFSTSDKALGPLSDIVRDAVDSAIETARRDGRRTVLDRDVPGST